MLPQSPSNFVPIYSRIMNLIIHDSRLHNTMFNVIADNKARLTVMTAQHQQNPSPR
jgi:hypothetical protein